MVTYGGMAKLPVTVPVVGFTASLLRVLDKPLTSDLI